MSASPDIDEAVPFRLCSKALEWAKDTRPDVAFLDIQLRGMTGIQLAEKLKEMYPDLPIVFVTGYREYAFDAIQLHVAGYLLKPVTAYSDAVACILNGDAAALAKLGTLEGKRFLADQAESIKDPADYVALINKSVESKSSSGGFFKRLFK